MIEIQDVSKQFDCVTALRHLTLKVQDGSVFGLVGSNGAGWQGCTAACTRGGARTTLPGWKSCSLFPLTLGWAR